MTAVIEVSKKLCKKCGGNERYRDGRCVACRKAAARRWNEKHRRAYMAQWRSENRDRQRSYHLRGRYGLTEESYGEMMESQGGVCAVCHRPEIARHRSGTVRHLCVDHDHATGEVRGLLCHKCNRVLGLLRDDRDFLQRALDYLEGATA